MDYVEACDILEELNNTLKFIPYSSKEWGVQVTRMAKLQLYIQEYDKWADAQAKKWDMQMTYEQAITPEDICNVL